MLRITLDNENKTLQINRNVYRLLEKDEDGLFVITLYTKDSFDKIKHESERSSCFNVVECDYVNMTMKIMIYV